MPEPNRNSREKIGTANLSNLGVVDIYYAGGSTFEFDIRNDTGKYLRITKTKLEQLVDQGLVVITAPKRYADITRSISSDGTTKNQNADGTPKSAVNRTMDMLSQENIISQRTDGKYEVVDFDEDKPRKKQVSIFQDEDEAPAPSRPPERPSRPADDAHLFGDDGEDDLPQPRRRRSTAFEDKHRSELRRQALEGQSREDQALLDRLDSQRREAPIEEGRPAKKRKAGTGGMPGDLNGDGVVDKFDEFEEERRSKSIVLLGLLILATAGGVMLSMVMHAVTSNLMEMAGIRVSHDNQIVQDASNQESGAVQGETGGQAADVTEAQGDGAGGDDASQQQAAAKDAASYYSLGERSYDPEASVRDMPLADQATQKAAMGYIDKLHELYHTGKVKEVQNMVALNAIADTLGNAYANYAKDIQNLDDGERERLAKEWAAQFDRKEREYIVDHDTTRSIFGGKIREVRADLTNDPADSEKPDKFYIIMESVDGDHQRVGLVFNRGKDGSFAVSNILAPDGYIKMISEGEVDGAEK